MSHLFEEMSGLKWRNFPDNLLGLHLSFVNKNNPVADIVYEYTNTRQQSIRNKEDDPDPGNYFRHGIYKSSFTYYQKMIGTPLFFPVVLNEDEKVTDLLSNRFFAHHIGVSGSLTHSLRWKGLFTYIKHFGLYTSPYEKTKKQLSGLLEVHYANSNSPIDLGFTIAVDSGNSFDHIIGLQVSVAKIF